jgi:hypothetical protein
MNMQEIQAVSKAIQEEKAAAYKQGLNDGVVNALSELREVYGKELELTDIWGSYMKEENN